MTGSPSKTSLKSSVSPAPEPSPRYFVVRPFEYGGRLLRAGDEFVPAGGPWDALLIHDPKRIRIAGVPPVPGTRKG